MIHNGIEYANDAGLRRRPRAAQRQRKASAIDVAAVAEMWRHGSVVRSWLLDLTAEFLKRDAELAISRRSSPDSGEGRWTAVEAIEQGVPAPVMSRCADDALREPGKTEYATSSWR